MIQILALLGLRRFRGRPPDAAGAIAAFLRHLDRLEPRGDR